MTVEAPEVSVVAASELDPSDPEAHVDLDRWSRLAVAALRTEAAGPGELTLLFVDETAMAELNETHMGDTGPTDVLAFPIDGADKAAAMPGVPALLGDVVVCPAVARRYAADHGVTFDDEVALLVVHGVLHVLGHDHAEPDETRRMRAREQALLAAHHRS